LEIFGFSEKVVIGSMPFLNLILLLLLVLIIFNDDLKINLLFQKYSLLVSVFSQQKIIYSSYEDHLLHHHNLLFHISIFFFQYLILILKFMHHFDQIKIGILIHLKELKY